MEALAYKYVSDTGASWYCTELEDQDILDPNVYPIYSITEDTECVFGGE